MDKSLLLIQEAPGKHLALYCTLTDKSCIAPHPRLSCGTCMFLQLGADVSGLFQNLVLHGALPHPKVTQCGQGKAPVLLPLWTVICQNQTWNTACVKSWCSNTKLFKMHKCKSGTQKNNKYVCIQQSQPNIKLMEDTQKHYVSVYLSVSVSVSLYLCIAWYEKSTCDLVVQKTQWLWWPVLLWWPVDWPTPPQDEDQCTDCR